MHVNRCTSFCTAALQHLVSTFVAVSKKSVVMPWFVNTAELLQCGVNDAWQKGTLHLPIPEDIGQKYPIVQSSDDHAC